MKTILPQSVIDAVMGNDLFMARSLLKELPELTRARLLAVLRQIVVILENIERGRYD
jgi:hypothetical protein